MGAYSKDLRLKVLAAADRGVPRKVVVGLFGVSLATLKRWLKRRKEGEDLGPKPSPGRTPTILATDEEKRALWEQLEANDEAALERHCGLWEGERGVRVSVATMSRAIRNKLGWTYEKDAGCLRARRRAEECLARAPEQQGGPEAVRLCGRVLDQRARMVPLRARAPEGQRAYGKAPRNRKENVTLICSISLAGGVGASMSVEGPADGEAFLLYVGHFLRPTLKRGQIVVMDDLQVHKMRRVRELIEERDRSLVFLPSYSPDFDPIEQAFSKIKGILRKAKARTFEALVEATGHALWAVTAQDANGYFNRCGYGAPRAHSL